MSCRADADAAKEALDLSQETEETQKLYGLGQGRNARVRHALLDRSAVGLNAASALCSCSSAVQPWDTHTGIRTALPAICKRTDQPAAALVTDLKRRGLLDTTIVHWGRRDRRLPVTEGEPATCGRDHNGQGFSTWLAGGGIKPGMTFGETDEFGHRAVKDIVTANDFQATLLHQFGLDHAKLSFLHNGQEQT